MCRIPSVEVGRTPETKRKNPRGLKNLTDAPWRLSVILSSDFLLLSSYYEPHALLEMEGSEDPTPVLRDSTAWQAKDNSKIGIQVP